MELRESIQAINKRLIDEFGRELNGLPRFRVVFSEDQYEKRWSDYSESGVLLSKPEVQLRPKYKQWVQRKYILERLVPTPEGSDVIEKMSYEPAWIFHDKNGNYLPPFFDGCKFVIESLFSAMGKAGLYAKYKDPTLTLEEKSAQIDKVERELFGNETAVGDHLALRTGIVVPSNNTTH